MIELAGRMVGKERTMTLLEQIQQQLRKLLYQRLRKAGPFFDEPARQKEWVWV
jgi:hypothetical protein